VGLGLQWARMDCLWLPVTSVGLALGGCRAEIRRGLSLVFAGWLLVAANSCRRAQAARDYRAQLVLCWCGACASLRVLGPIPCGPLLPLNTGLKRARAN